MYAERQAQKGAALRAHEERVIAEMLARVPSDFANWLAGFIDGEGCFAIGYRKANHTYACRLAISLRDDDGDTLQEIGRTLGFGLVMAATRRSASKRGFDTKPGAMWIASSRLDCAQLVALFDRYPLRAKKRRDFAIWREAVEIWMQIHRGGQGGINAGRWRRMAELKTMLSEIRVYQGSALTVPEPLELDAVAAGHDLALF